MEKVSLKEANIVYGKWTTAYNTLTTILKYTLQEKSKDMLPRYFTIAYAKRLFANQISCSKI